MYHRYKDFTVLITKISRSIKRIKTFEMEEINLKELLIKEEHPWIGMQVKELDISRQDLIVMIQRRNKVIIPNGATMIRKDDKVVMYSHLKK